MPSSADELQAAKDKASKLSTKLGLYATAMDNINKALAGEKKGMLGRVKAHMIKISPADLKGEVSEDEAAED